MNRIKGTAEAWDERRLGADEAHARVAGPEHLAALEDALGMQAISIRLPRQLVDAYKLIASHHGIGYQPLMRDILQRFVPEGLGEVMQHQQHRAAEAQGRIKELNGPAGSGAASTSPKRRKAA